MKKDFHDRSADKRDTEVYYSSIWMVFYKEVQ